jgi:hypothetical protein
MSPAGEPGGLVTVAEAASEFEAQTIVAVLAEAGIEAAVFPLAAIPIPDPLRNRPAGRMPVQVAAGDLARARAALAEAKDAAARLDWDSVEVGEPPPEVAAVLERPRRPRRMRFLVLAVLAIAVLLSLAVITSSFPWR